VWSFLGSFSRQIRPAPLPCKGALFSRGADYSTRGGLCQPKKRVLPRKIGPFYTLQPRSLRSLSFTYRTVGDRVIPKRGGRFPAAPIGPSRLCRRRAGAESVLGGRDGVRAPVVTARIIELNEPEQFRQRNLPIPRRIVARVRAAALVRPRARNIAVFRGFRRRYAVESGGVREANYTQRLGKPDPSGVRVVIRATSSAIVVRAGTRSIFTRCGENY